MVKPFKELLFCTFDIKTLIWAGLKSMPEVVNYRLVVFVFRSLIMCPKRPLNVFDYYYSYRLLRYYYSLLLSSNIFSSYFIFYSVHFFLSYYSLILRSFYYICRCYRYFSSLILRISRTLFVFGSMTSYTFLGLGWVWSMLLFFKRIDLWTWNLKLNL